MPNTAKTAKRSMLKGAMDVAFGTLVITSPCCPLLHSHRGPGAASKSGRAFPAQTPPDPMVLRALDIQYEVLSLPIDLLVFANVLLWLRKNLWTATGM